MNPSTPPPLPAPVASLAFAERRGPTTFGSVFLGVLLLEIFALRKPGSWVKFGLFVVGLIVVTKLSVPRGDAALFSTWMVDVVAVQVVPLLCLVTGGGILRNQIRNFTIEYVWTRSARKLHLVLAAWGVTVLLVFAQSVAATLVVHATGSVLGVSDLWSGLPLLLAAELVSVLAFSALALALGVFSGKYMVFGIIYGLFIEIGASRIPTNLNRISVTHHVQELLTLGSGIIESPFRNVILPSLMGVGVITAIGLAVACLIFSRRQYNVGGEKEA